MTDSGMFETNLRDERFLPFEGAGAISTWSARRSAEIPAFDYSTITDVILHVRYTARDGGRAPRNGTRSNSLRQLPPPQRTPRPGPVTRAARRVCATTSQPSGTPSPPGQSTSAQAHNELLPVRSARRDTDDVFDYAVFRGRRDSYAEDNAGAGHDGRQPALTRLDHARPLAKTRAVLTRDETKEVYAIVAYTARVT